MKTLLTLKEYTFLMADYYIKFGISNKPNAGSKAMRDIMDLLESKSWRRMPALPVNAPKLLKLLDIPILVFHLVFKLSKGSKIMYFLPSNHFRIRLINRLRPLGAYRSVCFINDIDSMRMDKSPDYCRRERQSLVSADIIIAPNENSTQILRRKFGCSGRIESIGIWDYLLPEPVCTQSSYNGLIAFSGNLVKSTFIGHLGSLPLTFRAWGAKPVGVELPENVEYMGMGLPDEMPEMVSSCSWGLVWEGDSIETCSGRWGEYSSFCNHHKAGLYLASGLPIIVWSGGGAARFVKHYECGIVIDSLNQLAEILSSVSEDDYSRIKSRIAPVQEKIRRGGFFLDALERIS